DPRRGQGPPPPRVSHSPAGEMTAPGPLERAVIASRLRLEGVTFGRNPLPSLRGATPLVVRRSNLAELGSGGPRQRPTSAPGPATSPKGSGVLRIPLRLFVLAMTIGLPVRAHAFSCVGSRFWEHQRSASQIA